MVLVDGDVASNVVDSYMTLIACMLKEIALMTLSGVHLYRLYRSDDVTFSPLWELVECPCVATGVKKFNMNKKVFKVNKKSIPRQILMQMKQ